MLREEIKRLRAASPRDLAKFGITVGSVFLVLGLIFLIPKWHKDWYWWFFVPAASLITLGVSAPRSLKWVYVGWLSIALIVGAIVSTVLLIALFYLVVTPLGFLAQVLGKDFLNRKLDAKQSSYWILRDDSQPRGKHEYERQF